MVPLPLVDWSSAIVTDEYISSCTGTRTLSAPSVQLLYLSATVHTRGQARQPPIAQKCVCTKLSATALVHTPRIPRNAHYTGKGANSCGGS